MSRLPFLRECCCYYNSSEIIGHYCFFVCTSLHQSCASLGRTNPRTGAATTTTQPQPYVPRIFRLQSWLSRPHLHCPFTPHDNADYNPAPFDVPAPPAGASTDIDPPHGSARAGARLLREARCDPRTTCGTADAFPARPTGLYHPARALQSWPRRRAGCAGTYPSDGETGGTEYAQGDGEGEGLRGRRRGTMVPAMDAVRLGGLGKDAEGSVYCCGMMMIGCLPSDGESNVSENRIRGLQYLVGNLRYAAEGTYV
jgi:hypothetical protein